MSRRDKLDVGSLNQVRGRYYYKVKLPGTDKRKSYPLIPPGHQKSTREKRTAIALANKMYKCAEENPEGNDSEYDGSLSSLRDLYIESHKIKIADKPDRVQRKELRFMQPAIDDLIQFFESKKLSLLTADVTPNRIYLWREHLNYIKKVCRDTINKKVNVVKNMLRYALMHEMESAEAVSRILEIRPIKKGDPDAFDYPEVEPADWDVVTKLFPYLSPMFQDMLSIMRYTGARPGEIRLMRPCDIDKSDPDAWVYERSDHKTMRYGHERHIVIGKRAQPFLSKYLLRPVEDYCFQIEATGKTYTDESFSKRITRAVKKYNNDHPDDKIDFHAHQLRHTFGTEVCLEYGLETAKHVLGHATELMTKRYTRQAEKILRMKDAKKAIKKLG